jgi:hypothetical protein
MTFKLDEVVVYNGNTPFKMLAQPGAMAKVKGLVDSEGRMLLVEWMDSSFRNGQQNGQYMADMFSPVPDASQKPWYSFTITKEVLRKEIFMRGFPVVAMRLHNALDALIMKAMGEEPKDEPPKQLPVGT